MNNETLEGGDTGAEEIKASVASSDDEWTTLSVLQSIGVFCLAGVAEISGGWMVWVAIRGHGEINKRKPWWYAAVGSLVLICYGFIPCLQPKDTFGRIYAAYGGFFIVLSFLFGWGLDGDKPDLGDIIGGAIALAGVCVLMFWPR
jgi:drug/metabolite transporter superfamily protein YnfA